MRPKSMPPMERSKAFEACAAMVIGILKALQGNANGRESKSVPEQKPTRRSGRRKPSLP